MERNIKVKAVKDQSVITNAPKCLEGMKMGDELVITKFPAVREYSEVAKYMKGVSFNVSPAVQWNLTCGEKFIFSIYPEMFRDERIKAIKIMRDNGYTGDFSDCRVDIYPDMVEFAKKKDEPKKAEEKKLYSIYVDDKKKDKSIIDEMISKVDKDRLFKMICISLGRGRKPSEEVMNRVLNDWATNKYEFYLAFGRNLSISAPISFEVDDNEMAGCVNELYSMYPKYAATIDLVRRNGNITAFVKNELPRVDFFAKYCPQDIYKPGMKVSRFFSGLFQDDKFDLDFSKVMQNRLVKGNVVISIDPYDFLTSATTMHDWHSCHGLDQCKRAGSYSFMLDSSSMVAFRDNGKTYTYDMFGKLAFSGGSKSWRQMVHVDKKSCACLFSREYPQNKIIDGVRDTIRDLLETTLSGYLGIENMWDNYGDLERMAQNAYFGGNVIYHDVSGAHYSDIANWASLVRNYAGLTKALVAPANTDMDKVDIRVGTVLYCLKCGKKLSRDSDGVLCGACD